MSNLLELATKKFKENKEVDFNLGLIDFLCYCYLHLKPCCYGAKIETKLISLLGISSVAASLDRGDAFFGKFFAEIKCTFLDKKNSYNLTHLRKWQNFNFYIFCLIDCENDFNPEFYVLDKKVMDKIKTTAMNGTKESNINNDKVAMRATVKKNGDIHKVLKKKNKLSGTSFSDLKKFTDKLK